MTPAPTSPAVGETITVRVGDPVAGGACLSRLDGQVVFVTGVLPGELVQATVTGSGRGGGFLRAAVTDVIEASPHRVDPPCRLADECGGCDWQHTDLAYQRELKAAVIRDALKRTGGVTAIGGNSLADAVTVEAIDDGDGLGWRSRMRYAIDEDGAVGLRAARSHRIIPAADCPLALAALASAVPERVTNFGKQRALVAVETSGGDVELGTTATQRTLAESVLGRDFSVDINGFWQVHPRAALTLVEAVLEFAELQPGQSALDLYSGVGLFAAFLGEAVGADGNVTAVEGDAVAVELARLNTADLQSVYHQQGDTLKWLRQNVQTLGDVDVVVLDPPRSGAKRAVLAEVVKVHPRRIIYIACDPVALARDTKILRESSYHLNALRAFDLFPMTIHVECVAVFEPISVA